MCVQSGFMQGMHSQGFALIGFTLILQSLSFYLLYCFIPNAATGLVKEHHERLEDIFRLPPEPPQQRGCCTPIARARCRITWPLTGRCRRAPR